MDLCSLFQAIDSLGAGWLAPDPGPGHAHNKHFMNMCKSKSIPTAGGPVTRTFQTRGLTSGHASVPAQPLGGTD